MPKSEWEDTAHRALFLLWIYPTWKQTCCNLHQLQRHISNPKESIRPKYRQAYNGTTSYPVLDKDAAVVYADERTVVAFPLPGLEDTLHEVDGVS